MKTIQRLVILLLVLLGCTTGAWALEQDSDGYYLIGSVQDWKDFAAIVETTNDANAKMIADVDLGDDQTHIGSMTQDGTTFKGTFDGQGYTLTVAYVGRSKQIVAPFTNVQGATIKNLHLDGSISSVFAFIGVVGYVRGSGYTTTVSNVWNSATMNIQSGEWAQSSAIVGGFNNGSVVITDCLFTGTFTTNRGGYCGCFTGYDYSSGSITQTNCLSTGTFNMSGTGFRGTHSNCYVSSFPATYPSGVTEATDESLADGTITSALGDAWVQDPGTGQPMLKIFTTMRQDENGNYLIGSLTDWKRFAAIVETTNDANAKMIRDVDLGDDQTTIGHPNENPNYHFKGIFDGQGHTLTVHYVKQGEKDICSPFPNISEATIKNLHITGTIESSTACQPAAIGCVRYGTSTIENVWSSIELTSTKSAWCEASGLVGCVDGYKGGHLVMTNCIVSGNVKSSGGYEGCFIGYINSGGSATVSNCLSVANFEYSGTSGFMGNYTNCYVKQFPSTIPSDMRITDEQLADGTIATALGNAWVQDPERGIPMLKIFANAGGEVPVTDLSATSTANTYIVSAAGKYKFKATVKGNGGLDPLTGTIATPNDAASIAGVKVLWELGDTYGRAIKYEDGAYDISYSDGYVYFSTPNTFTTGVACVAIYDSSDNILWSWNIWCTPEPGTVTYNGNTFMDRNLCAIDLNNNRGFLYQWGRKDAFSAATGSYASFTFVPALSMVFNTVRGIQTIDYCIKHPTTHVNNGDENSWMSREEYNSLPWRDDIKTIYDPCPAGWRVPTAAEQNGFSGLPGTGFSNAINEFGNPGSGYYRSSTISSYPKAYAFRQSGQQNNWGTNPAMAIRPVKEGIYFIYTVPASGLGTFSADVNIIVPSGLTAYYCTTLKNYDDGNLGIRVSKLNGIIPANTGVLLEGSAGLSYPLTATTVEATAPAGNSLEAVVESKHIAATEGDYTNFMMKGGKFIKIQQDSEDVKMPANRAYLPLLTAAISGSNAKEITLLWDEGEATGIEGLTPTPSPKGEGSIYNLNGQRISTPLKGINIINGRKVIVK